MNTRFFLLQVLTPFMGCLLGTLLLASPLLPQENLRTHGAKHVKNVHQTAQWDHGNRIAHSDLPSVLGQLDQIHDNYAQDMRDQALLYRREDHQQYPLVKPADVTEPKYQLVKPAGVTEPQEVALEAGDDPWAR